MNPLLAETFRTEFEASAISLVELLPSLLAAVVLVAVGVFAGRKIQPTVTQIGRRIELDDRVHETPVGQLFPEDSESVSRTAGVLAKYYVVLLAVFAAATHLGLQFVTNWSEYVITYVPSLLAGVLVIVVGFFAADYVADAVRRSEPVRESGFSALVAGSTKVLVCFVGVVIGLDMMGLDVTILYTFAQAFAFAAGLAIALAIGIAFGWGGKDYVADNVDDWFGQPTDAPADQAPMADDD